MYKVFINERTFLLTGTDTPFYSGSGVLHVRFDDSVAMDALIRLAEENHPTLHVIQVVNPDPDKLFAIFCSFYKLQEAAGGIVKNAKGETLVIYRRGKWDLPKGKIEKGEDPESAALREVEEETGIGGMRIVKEQPSTWHTFEKGDKRILKRTHWFDMTVAGNAAPVPQQEEDIEQALWAGPKKLEECRANTYASLVHFF